MAVCGRLRSPRLIEHEVHGQLKEFRLNKSREFFHLRYEKIRDVTERVIDKAGARVEERE
ncbi:GIY-YIG nuclease family protein [Sphingomonas oleivorans]|uniref:GIY-YIG nuclease family protein n=1 Tax=Sphingomonas oleivorans TaxID=1735121 RepID=UPI000D35FF71